MSNQAPQTFVIVTRSYGELSVCPATQANAEIIFNNFKGNLDNEVVAIANAMEADTGIAFVPPRSLRDALREVVTLTPGQPAPKLRGLFYGPAPREGEDTRPEVILEAAWVQELALFMLEVGWTKDSLEKLVYGRDLNKLHPENRLAFLAPFKTRMLNPIQYMAYDDMMATAQGYRVIVKGAWKADANEVAIVRRILDFANNYLVDTGDVKFEVVPFEATWK